MEKSKINKNIHTKFILHGGGEGDGDKKHNDFFKEIVDSLPKEGGNILCVYFAVPDEMVKEKHKVYIEYFKRVNATGKMIKLKIASKENFIRELQWADAVYFRGGDTDLLLDQLKKYPTFKNSLSQKKVVAGSSAGVHILSKYFYSQSKGGIFAGFGLVDTKDICHYNEEKKPAIKSLRQYPGELVLLKEREFKIIIKK